MKKLVIFILLILFTQAGFGKTDVNKVINKLQKKFKKVDAIKIDFKQINTFKLTGVENEIFGTLWLTKDNKFRFETEDQTIVTNGETYWRYNKLEEQVLIDYAKKSSDDVFLTDFIFRVEDEYTAQLIQESDSKSGKVVEIKLTPKNVEESFFSYIKIWVLEKNEDISKIQYVDYNDNETTYEIEKLDSKPELGETIFNFKIPDGIEAVDLRF